MAKAMLSARLDGQMSEEKRRNTQRTQERTVASNLLNLRDAGLHKTQELLKKVPGGAPPSILDSPSNQAVEKTPPSSPASMLDQSSVDEGSGMKFTCV